MKEITLSELLSHFDESLHAQIKKLSKQSDTEYLVVFINETFDSSRFGDKSCLKIGPNSTYKSLDEVKDHHLHDLPSMRQYPKYYWTQDTLHFPTQLNTASENN